MITSEFERGDVVTLHRPGHKYHKRIGGVYSITSPDPSGLSFVGRENRKGSILHIQLCNGVLVPCSREELKKRERLVI